ncbi:MAG: hypothetical protein ACXVAB_06065, partial [Thermodesulfobacteriota bacterium]
MAQIVSFLKKARPNDANLGESLRVISEYLSASGSVFLRLKHDAETEAWQTEGIGSWPPANMHALSLDSMSVPDSVWQALKKREIIPFCLSR